MTKQNHKIVMDGDSLENLISFLRSFRDDQGWEFDKDNDGRCTACGMTTHTQDCPSQWMAQAIDSLENAT